ncbi:Uncharacterized protein FKW44_015720, partial [Caligus rogercresseyi]
HQGIEKTKRRARQTVYWPGYTNDIKTTVEACSSCQYYRSSLPQEPLVQEKIPLRPFEMATSDLFYYGGNQYLVYADRTSGFPLIAKYNGDPSASDVIKDLRRFFSLMGVPNILRSDNGPQYASEEMKKFSR